MVGWSFGKTQSEHENGDEGLIRSCEVRANHMERVICPIPSRERHDDRVVEVFLHAFKGGLYTKDITASMSVIPGSSHRS
jgi:hypothetical protein